MMTTAVMLAVLTGIIPWRPPAPPGMPNNNYVQGAAPVRVGNNVILWVNSGHCCVSPDQAWEGVYAFSWSKWFPLWGANQWGTEPWRNEHEIAYPTAVWWARSDGGGWLAAYASTVSSGELSFSNKHHSVRLVDVVEPEKGELAAASADLSRHVWIGWAFSRLDPLLPWPLRVPRWVRPLGPIQIWGVFPVSLLSDSLGNVMLWAWDYTSGNVVGYAVDESMGARLITVATFAAPIGGVGTLPHAPALTDIARGMWGELYALEGLSHLTTEVKEWVSWPRCGLPAGSWWARTGRTIQLSGHTVFDCGYMKNQYGDRAEPVIIVCNTSPGGLYADSGQWELRWWADDGADIPLEWLQRPATRVIVRR